MDEDIQSEIKKIINEIESKSVNGNYIYRGEPETHEEHPHYGKVSSSLWRDFGLDMEGFNIEAVQTEMLSSAQKHIGNQLQDFRVDLAASNFKILTEIQHYGGKTNLIDFTTDYFIALFFACDGHHNRNGRVILQKTEDIQNMIERPRNPRHRVIAQKSVFVRPPKGYIEPNEDDIVTILGDLKQWILQHLRKYHDISTETIYNDVYGFIKHQKIHGGAYTQVFWGFACQKRGDEATDSEEKQREYEESIEHYTQAIKLKPDLAEAYNNLGLIYEQRGDYNKAIENFDRAIYLNPNYAEAYSNLGLVYKQQGDYEDAIRNFDRAIYLNPNHVTSYNNRGIAYTRQGTYEKAIADFTQAIQLNPDLAEPYNNRGNTYTQRRDYDRAIEDYTRAIAVNPNYAEAYKGRGVAYYDKGEIECAIADYTRAIELNPDYAEASNNLEAARRTLDR